MTNEIDRRTMLTGTVAAGALIQPEKQVKAEDNGAVAPAKKALTACPTGSGQWEELTTSDAHLNLFAWLVADSGLKGFSKQNLADWIKRQDDDDWTVEIWAYYVGSAPIDQTNISHGFVVAHGLNKTFFRLGPTGARMCTEWKRKRRVKKVVDSFYHKFSSIQGQNKTRYWLLKPRLRGKRLTVVPLFTYLRKGKRQNVKIITATAPGHTKAHEYVKVKT